MSCPDLLHLVCRTALVTGQGASLLRSCYELHSSDLLVRTLPRSEDRLGLSCAPGYEVLGSTLADRLHYVALGIGGRRGRAPPTEAAPVREGRAPLQDRIPVPAKSTGNGTCVQVNPRNKPEAPTACVPSLPLTATPTCAWRAARAVVCPMPIATGKSAQLIIMCRSNGGDLV